MLANIVGWSAWKAKNPEIKVIIKNKSEMKYLDLPAYKTENLYENKDVIIADKYNIKDVAIG